MNEAAIHQVLLASFLAVALLIFPVLLFVSAPYGRHSRNGWGPRISSRAGWVLMELPAVLVLGLLFALSDRTSSATAIVFLGVWQLHYVQRALIFPLRLPSASKPMPLLIAASGLSFNLVNGYLNGRYLFTLAPEYPVTWLLDPRFLLGLLVFLAGFAINLQSDAILRRLRHPGELGYRIPAGGLFRWVSCPNYLGEMLEWSGWAIATWSPAGLAFALWTVANLLPRAISHHRWYRATFPDYPIERRALVPYLF